MQRIAKSLLVAAVVLGAFVPNAFAAFGIQSFTADVFKQDGTTVETQAGSTPYTGVTDFTLNPGVIPLTTDEQVKRIRVDLPPGLISNPQATPQCAQADFPNCDAKTQIGTVDLTAMGLPYSTAVYNLEPTADHVSDFGFSVLGILTTHIIGGVRDRSDYGLFFTIDVPQGISLSHSKLTFFGDPGAHGTGAAHAPFIRLPTACAGIQKTSLTVDTYEGHTYKRDDFTDVGASGCDQVPFDPSISVTPSTTQRDAPIGATIDVGVPWQTDPTKLASSHVKNTVVTLPPGMSISPSAANGLQACTDDQFGQGTHSSIPCPDSSKVGTAEIDTPVLGAPLEGSVYLGQPLADNPYRLFVVV